MKPEISVQLYSVRDNLTADYEKTLRAIHAMGFNIVETAGFPGTTFEKAKALFKKLNLTSPTCHCRLPIGDDKNKVIEDVLALGGKYLFTGCSPKGKEDFSSIDAIKAVAEVYTNAADFASKYGIQVGCHNHGWEMADVNGKAAYKYFLENTPETVLWEADTFWVAFGGRNPTDFITELGKRGKAVHFKDGLLAKKEVFKADTINGIQVVTSNEKPFKPAGTADVDLQGASAAAKFAEYAVIELDSYDANIMDAIRQSYNYLCKSGIASGRL